MKESTDILINRLLLFPKEFLIDRLLLFYEEYLRLRKENSELLCQVAELRKKSGLFKEQLSPKENSLDQKNVLHKNSKEWNLNYIYNRYCRIYRIDTYININSHKILSLRT